MILGRTHAAAALGSAVGAGNGAHTSIPEKMSTRRRRRFAWWTVPVALGLWGVVLRTMGLVQFGGPGAGRFGVRVVGDPRTVVILLVAALALVRFAHHLRRARGLSG